MEDEREAIPVVWNVGPVPCGGALVTADIKVKMRKLTAIYRNRRNWSWLLDPHRPCVPPILPEVAASGKNQLAAEPGSLDSEKSLLAVDLGG